MQFIEKMSRDLVSFAGTLDMTQWAILSVITCVIGYLMLKGNNIRGG